MEVLTAILADLEHVHKRKVPENALANATIYTTPEYRQQFEKKWGYKAEAIGVLLPPEDWEKLKETLGIPKYLGAQEYLPHKCIACREGFVIIKQNAHYPAWNLDHEMLHFAQFEHAEEFRKFVESFEKHPVANSAQRRIEAELIYEVCAYRDNIALGVPGKDWNWALNYLKEHYLEDELRNRVKEEDIPKIRKRLSDELVKVIRLVERPRNQQELTRIFFTLAYREPFNELIEKLS
jgi:hypothetical protein